jgi:hypothetical protein
MEAYAAADAAEQARLLRAFEVICGDPEGDAEVIRISQNRDVCGRWFGNWLVLYFLDHPIRTVVITD